MYNLLRSTERQMQQIPNFDLLSETMGLSPYQRQVLERQYDKYNVSRLVKRGDILYAPHVSKGGVFYAARRLLMGTPADLIGKNKTLLAGKRRIKFYACGYHCVDIGDYKYYADPNGQAISRDLFMRAIGEKKR